MSIAAVTDEQRVAALHALNILDTPAELRFDRVTRLAQQLFGVPMVSVTLVDADRAWRKSFQGPLTQETPRQDVLCELTFRQPSTLVVEDASVHDLVATNPYVIEDPRLRFYAGHPLLAPGGEPIGALCIMDTRPREMSPAELEVLRDLAGWVQRELVRDQELDSARDVQRSLLPHVRPQIGGYELVGMCLQARGVGGDFYDWYPVPGGWQFTIADVMGKGMGAALIAATTRALLRGGAISTDLAQGFKQASGLLNLDLDETGTFVTAFHGRLHPDSGAVKYVDAGHGLALHIQADGSLHRLGSDSLPLGIDPAEDWVAGELHLAPGDSLICGSDGLLDLYEEDHEAGIAAVVAANAVSAEEMVEQVARYAAGRELPDDVTLLALRRQPR